MKKSMIIAAVLAIASTASVAFAGPDWKTPTVTPDYAGQSSNVKSTTSTVTNPGGKTDSTTTCLKGCGKK